MWIHWAIRCVYTWSTLTVWNTLLLSEPMNDKNPWLRMRELHKQWTSTVYQIRNTVCVFNSVTLHSYLSISIWYLHVPYFTWSLKGGSWGDVLGCLADKKLWFREVKRPLKTWQGPGRKQLNLLTSPGTPTHTHTLSESVPCCPFLTFFVPHLKG